jgi:hypothetical protein
MAENEKASEPAAPTTLAIPGTPPVPPKRSPGHRGADVKDTVAEMAAKAHEISLEAGSKMAAAMKDVINAAAGLTGFVVESARDLVQYMVRRGQMTQEEADKLIREVEASMPKRKPSAPVAAVKSSSAPKPTHAPASSPKPAMKAVAKPSGKKAASPATHVAKKAATKKPAVKKPVAKKAAAKKPAAKKPAPKKSAPSRSTAKKKPTKKAARR